MTVNEEYYHLAYRLLREPTRIPVEGEDDPQITVSATQGEIIKCASTDVKLPSMVGFNSNYSIEWSVSVEPALAQTTLQMIDDLEAQSVNMTTFDIPKSLVEAFPIGEHTITVEATAMNHIGNEAMSSAQVVAKTNLIQYDIDTTASTFHIINTEVFEYMPSVSFP